MTRSRTGSNWLMSMLRNQPDIIARGEMMSTLGNRSIADRLQDCFAADPGTAAVGFKALYYHPNDGDPQELREALDRLADLRVIHLLRRNILRAIVSREIAVRTGVWSHSRRKIRLPSRLGRSPSTCPT